MKKMSSASTARILGAIDRVEAAEKARAERFHKSLKPIKWSEKQAREYKRYIPNDITRLEYEKTPNMEAAFRDRRTGAIYGTGPVHDEDVLERIGALEKADAYVDLDPGFINAEGTRFLAKGGDATWQKIGPGKLKSREYGRKSSSGGGEVQVQGYTRDGRPVSAYTRSRPS